MQPVVESPAVHQHLPFYRHLYFQVIVAIVLGALLGYFSPELAAKFNRWAMPSSSWSR
jgi:Na+/H+-dicarboxylate symporter